VLVALALAGAATTRARADGEPAPATTERSVEVVLLGGGTDTGALVDTVRELLGRLGLVANVHAVSGDEDAARIARGASVARVVVDLRGKDETVLTTSGREDTPSRRVVRRDSSPSVAREELAHAVQGAIEAQLFVDGDRPPKPPAPYVPPEPHDGPVAIVIPPAPPPRDATPPKPVVAPWGFDVTPLAGAGLFSSEAGPVAHLGGELGFAWRKSTIAPSIALSARAILPFEGEAAAVSAHANVVALRLHGGLQVLRTSWLALGVVAGAGFDVVTVEPRSRTLPPNVLSGSTTRVDPILTLGVRADFPIVSSVALTILLVGDADLVARSYVVRTGATNDVALEPWRIRPALLAGFSFTPFGGGTFAPRGTP
jgi:hypothetical protein